MKIPSHSENFDSEVRIAAYLFVPSCGGTDGVPSEGLMAPNRINYLTHAPPPPPLSAVSLPDIFRRRAAPDTNAPFGKTILVQSERDGATDREMYLMTSVPSKNGLNPFNSAFECLQLMARILTPPGARASTY